MLVIKEMFKNSENKFLVTKSLMEVKHGRMHYISENEMRKRYGKAKLEFYNLMGEEK